MIVNAFGGGNRLQKAALLDYWRAQNPSISDSMLNWKIHDLLRRGELVSIGRGSYELPSKAEYLPRVTARLKELATLVRRAFPYLDFSIFHTEPLSGLMQHIPGKHLMILEVERDGSESVFFRLKELGLQTYLQPDLNTMVRYVAFENESLIVQPLLSEAPLLQVEGIQVPAMEKLLVDLACEKAIYHAYQGAELRHIFENALEAYHIREDRLLRYAARRNRKKMVMTLLKDAKTGLR